MNSLKTTQGKMKFQVSSEELLESLRLLGEVVRNSFENEAMSTLQKQLVDLKKLPLSFQEELQKGKLHKHIRNMGRVLKKCSENQPTTTLQFTDAIATRLQNFSLVIQELEGYPIENITKSLEQLFQKEGIESFSVKSFLKKFKKALINIMIKHYRFHEEATFDLLVEHELKNLKVDYIIQNKTLQFLEPHKYKQYINCLNKGFNALYHDMKAYTDFSNPFFEAADKLFQNIIAKLNQVAGIDNPEIEIPNTTPIDSETKNYPTHIFRRHQDFQLFNSIMQSNPTPEKIGFVFREMSEKEEPPTIVVKETVFRKWFNQESGYNMELKNPIKTLLRINNYSDKKELYTSKKELLKATA